MNIKRFVAAALSMFVFVFLYEWLVHGFLLSGFYEKTPHVWREYSVMEANMPYAMLFQLALSVWTAFVFSQIFPQGGVGKGLFFGLYFGVFAAILTATWVLWIAVPTQLGGCWFLSGLGLGLGSGCILGAIYHKNGGQVV